MNFRDLIKKHKREVPLYFIAAGLPLITWFHIQYTGMESEAWFPNQSAWIDVFLYGKSRCVHFTALLMAAVLAVRAMRKRNKKFGKEWMWVLGFGVLQLISAFASNYPQQSFTGSIEQYESVWVLLGYLVIGCYSYQCVLDSNDSEPIFKALFMGVILSCLIGVTQLIQVDFWNTELGKSILVPDKYESLRESIRFSFGENEFHSVYLASYNPNYAGIYLLMILPCMILWKKKKIRLMAVLVTLCMFATMSKTVIMALAVVLFIGFFLLRNTISEKLRKGVFGTVIGICVIAIVGIAVYERNTIWLSDTEKLQKIVCEEEYICITYQGEKIYFRDVPQESGGVKYEVLYEDGSKVALKWNENSGELEPYDEKLQGLYFKVYEKDDVRYAMFRYNDIPFRFTNDIGTGRYEYISINGKIDELETADKAFKNYDGLLSGRGYIWNRILPIISENCLIGTGPDTFLQVFPQNDYVSRANLGHAFFTQILTNAHSLYLHMAVQTGIPSVICFVVFVGIYLRKSWKIYSGKEIYSDMEKMGIAVFLGICGYLICGITFASNVCTTPVFWLLLGTGVGLNKINLNG